jgi:hypothetical protein
VARLSKAKYLHIALFAQLKGATYGYGRSPQTFKSIVCKDLEAADIPFQGGEWYVQAKDKPLWCQLVQGILPTKARLVLMHK